MPDSPSLAQQLALISELADNPLTLPPIFVRITGSITAGLLLRQCMYWMKRTRNPEGWFYKRLDEFQAEMCMGVKEFRLAREANERRKFLETKRQGVPPLVYFRADLAAVLEAISKQLESETNSAKRAEFNSAQKAESIVPKGQDQFSQKGSSIPPKGQKYDSAERAELYKEAETTRDHTETTSDFCSTLEAIKNGTAKQSDLYRNQHQLLAAESAEEFNSIEVAHAMCVEMALAGSENKLLIDDALKNYRAKHAAKSWKQCGEELLALWTEYQASKIEYKVGHKKFFSDGWYLRSAEWGKAKTAKRAVNKSESDYVQRVKGETGARAQQLFSSFREHMRGKVDPETFQGIIAPMKCCCLTETELHIICPANGTEHVSHRLHREISEWLPQQLAGVKFLTANLEVCA